jgi:regulator of cell morphogenesis and NO signaling
MSNILQETLASIVTRDHHSVAVLEKYHLDFCCNGKRTLQEACAAKLLDADAIANELQSAFNPASMKQMPFTEMTAEQLINHILIHHHFYVKQMMPQIHTHVEKVAMKHGERFPFMQTVYELFKEVENEMTCHMRKEEEILFPRIKQLEQLTVTNEKGSISAGFISGPVSVMEAEHEHAGEILYQIRSLTNNYTAPDGACNTFRIALAELKEFEEDLHQHVHLENNILFPKAQQMAERIS